MFKEGFLDKKEYAIRPDRRFVIFIWWILVIFLKGSLLSIWFHRYGFIKNKKARKP
jgi:hypothetical protein